MKITVRQAMAIRNAISQLDSYERVTKDGQAERHLRDSYKFTGAVRMTLAKNAARLAAIAEAFSAKRDALAVEFNSKGGRNADRAVKVEASSRIQQLLDEQCEVELGRVAESDLNLDANPIPISVLAALDAIIVSQSA